MINLVLNDIAEKHLRCGFLMKVSFPDRSVKKLSISAIQQASRKCAMSIQNRENALSPFITEFGNHINRHL